jgi:EamA domain-containing membrane protein RarD
VEMEANAKRFLWGIALVWVPWIPILVAFGYVLYQMSRVATGIGAVAGGFSEIFLMYGVAGTFVAQLFAVVLLSKSLLPGRPIRNFLSILSLCLSGLMIVVIAVFLWLSWSWAHHGG